MTPEEKIEALREWAASTYYDESSPTWFDAGYARARDEVRNIIDPPVLCNCGQEDVTGCAVVRGGFKHTEAECDECCPHGVFLSAVCEQCHPPTPKWRESVDRCVKAFPSDPLGDVLMHLSALSAPKADDATREWHLAHIIAVCEAQVGDGWEADPACWSGTVTLHTLIDRLSCDEVDDYYTPVGKVTDWQGLGHAAAAWLRSLTDGGAA